jgi:thiamine-monophosphate kinase
VGEQGILRSLRPYLSRAGGDLIVAAPDDDAAVWRTRAGLQVSTVDTMVEGIDFRPSWPGFHFRLLGRRLMAINLSDLAAMGAQPRDALISLCLPPTLPLESVRDLYRGIAEQGRRFGCAIAGGDISAIEGPLVLTAVLTGMIPAGRRPLRRSGARAGWQIAVTGTLGNAALGLRALERHQVPQRRWVKALLDPEPRVQAGLILSASGVSVAGDISDGLFREVARIAQPVRLGAVIDVAALPIDRRGKGAPGLADLGRSEDFELICAAPPHRVLAAAARMRRDLRLPLTVIGRLTLKSGIRIMEQGKEHQVDVLGYQHFH